jgi:4a-hydroxytetrahydrobiopterin dehydratase
MTELRSMRCRHRSGEADKLTRERADSLLANLDGWVFTDDRKAIRRVFEFDDYHRTMAFVNAAAWIAHVEDHHPDMEVGYNRCAVLFSTHSVGGLSENDFICAAKIDGLLA